MIQSDPASVGKICRPYWRITSGLFRIKTSLEEFAHPAEQRYLLAINLKFVISLCKFKKFDQKCVLPGAHLMACNLLPTRYEEQLASMVVQTIVSAWDFQRVMDGINTCFESSNKYMKMAVKKPTTNTPVARLKVGMQGSFNCSTVIALRSIAKYQRYLWYALRLTCPHGASFKEARSCVSSDTYRTGVHFSDLGLTRHESRLGQADQKNGIFSFLKMQQLLNVEVNERRPTFIVGSSFPVISHRLSLSATQSTFPRSYSRWRSPLIRWPRFPFPWSRT